MTEEYSAKQVEIAKGLAKIAKENNLSMSEITKIYNSFNHTVYFSDLFNGGTFNMYKPELEDKTLNITREYINLKENGFNKLK
jgi:hypothetical protein